MADVRKLLGDAPTEEVTAGTAGRADENAGKNASVESIAKLLTGGMQFLQAKDKADSDKATNEAAAAKQSAKAAGAMAVFETSQVLLDSQVAEEDALAEAKRQAAIKAGGDNLFVDAGAPPEAGGVPPQRDETKETVTTQLTKAETARAQAVSQGMSPARAARLYNQRLYEVARQHPAYANEVLAAAGGADTFRNAATEKYKYEQEQQRKADAANAEEIRKMYVAETGDFNSSPDEMRLYVAKNIAPRVSQISALDANIQIEQKKNTYNGVMQTKLMTENRTTLYQSYTASLAATFEGKYATPELRAEAVRAANVRAYNAIKARFPNVPDAEIKAQFGDAIAYSENLVRLADSRTPKEELVRLRTQNDLLLETNRSKLYQQRPDIAKAEVVSNALQNIGKLGLSTAAQDNFADRAFTGFVTAVGLRPDNDIGDDAISGRPNVGNDPKKAESFFAGMVGRFSNISGGMSSADAGTKDTVYRTVVAGLNDKNIVNNPKAIESALPLLSDLKLIETAKDTRYKRMGDEIGNKALTTYANKLRVDAERLVAGNANAMKMGVDNRTGLVTVRYTGNSALGDTENKRLSTLATQLEFKMNSAIKSHAHLRGSKDYAGSGAFLFGGN